MTDNTEKKDTYIEHVNNLDSSPKTTTFETIFMDQDFFLKQWDYPFLVNVYPGIFSTGGAIVNRGEAERIYKRRGIFLRLIFNRFGQRINFEVVRKLNDGYKNISDICELVNKIFSEGICNGIAIDEINTIGCTGADREFPITNVEPYDDCNADGICSGNFNLQNLNFPENLDDYNFMKDVFDWPWTLFSNPNMIQQGFNGCIACIRWYLVIGIYKGVTFNRFNQFLDLDYIAGANELFELETYKQVVQWLLAFGFSDRKTKLIPKKLRSSLTNNISARNFSETSGIGNVIDSVLNSNAPQTATTELYYDEETDEEFRYPPNAKIPWDQIRARFRNNTRRSIPTTSMTMTSTTNTSRLNNSNLVTSRLNSRINSQQKRILESTDINNNVSSINNIESTGEVISAGSTEVCEDCVNSKDPFQPLRGGLRNLTPLSFSFNRPGPGYLLRRRRNAEGETEFTPSIVSILNGTSPIGLGGLGGGGGAGSRVSAYLNNGRGATLTSINPGFNALFQ